MASYKEPGFQERVAAAGRARETALAKLRAKAPIDPAVLAERAERNRVKEALAAEKREAARLAREAEKAARAAEAAEAAAKAEANRKPVLTEAERKAARDARYAARKNRK